MSSSVVDQTLNAINSSNQSINREKNAQKQESSKTNLGSLTGLQKFRKDVVISAEKATGASTLSTPANAGKPQLPNPYANWKDLESMSNQEVSLIAILSKVLCEQARTNSRVWSTLWKQATQSMQIQVKMAPIIGKAIEGEYDAQSAATEAQATQSKYNGIINFTTFGGTLLGAAFAEYSDAESPFRNKGDAEFGDDAADLENANNPQEETSETINDTAKELEQAQGSFATRAKNTFKTFMSGMKTARQGTTSLMTKIQQVGMTMQMASAGATGMVDSKYQGEMAGYQKVQGQQQATEKVTEQYSQFYGMVFNRAEEIRQAAGQQIDNCTRILQQAVSDITSTVRGQFQG